jgi:hypothetical protein
MSLDDTAAHNFPSPASQDELYAFISKALLAQGFLEERDYFIAVYEGAADLVVEDIPSGTAGAIDAVAALGRKLEDLGWFVATARPKGQPRIQIGPYIGRRAERLPAVLFHATSAAKLPSIQEHGLLPREGGGTYLKRRYPPRVYLSRTKADVLAFIRGMAENGTPIPDPVLLAVDTKALDPGTALYVDEVSGLMEDEDLPHGVWTYHAIPPSAIRQKVQGVPEPERPSAPGFR